MIELHDTFKHEKFRFCPLRKYDKESFTDHNNINYRYDDPILLEYLKEGHNVGLLVGYGFDLAIDIDKLEIYELIKDDLPETLTQLSGIKKFPHLLYNAPYLKQKWNNIKQKEFRGFVEFLGKGKYIVVADSIVKNKKDSNDTTLYKYSLKSVKPIAFLPEKNLDRILTIVTEYYVQNRPIKNKIPKKVNPNIHWFDSVYPDDSKRYFNNSIEISNIKKLYKNKQGQLVFEAYFPDQDKKLSFALNRRTENKLLDILIDGKDRAIFYTIIHNSRYMRQIKEV